MRLPYLFPDGRYSAFGRWLALHRLRRHYYTRMALGSPNPTGCRCAECAEAQRYLRSIGVLE